MSPSAGAVDDGLPEPVDSDPNRNNADAGAAL